MKKLILLGLLVLSFSKVNAQISITFEEFLAGYGSISGTSDSYTSTDLTGVANLIALKGAGANWSFGGRTYTKETVTNTGVSFVDVATAPLNTDPDFAGATHCLKVQGETSTDYDFYSYFKVTSDGLFNMGSVADSMGTSLKFSSYVPPQQQMKFPFTYGTSWSSNSTVNSAFGVPGSTQTIMIESSCDGWGTLEMPTRSYKEKSPTTINDCLRLRTKTTTTTSYGPISISTMVHTYEWLTESSNSATVSSDSSDAPTSVGYSQGQTSNVHDVTSDADALHIRLSSNPASTETNLTFTNPVSGDVQVSLLNSLGSELKIVSNGYMPSGKITTIIDPSTLANGIYYVRVTTNGHSTMHKLVISR